MYGVRVLVLTITWLGSFAEALRSPQIRSLGPQSINLWILDAQNAKSRITAESKSKDFSEGHAVVTQGVPQEPLTLATAVDRVSKKYYDFRARWFQQPLDHFDETSEHTFHQRYWVNSRHYKPRKGAPVIVLDGGETSGEDRLPFLDTGIVDILTRATGGLGVVLEHRYYGESIPVSNFSTDALRFLNNAQAAADSANFMRHVKFDGIEEDLTAPGTPWIYYGGSYAGARAAHMKILYPDIVWGAIASSAVTHATLQNWQYMDVIRTAAEPGCSARIVESIKKVDYILANGPFLVKQTLKALFGLAHLKHDDDFAALLVNPLEWWQAKCWDPDFGSTMFDEFCESLRKPFGNIGVESFELPFGHPNRTTKLTDDVAIDVAVVNYGSWIKKNVVSHCPEGNSIEDCFGTYDDAKFQESGLDQDWRLWLFQVCTEWGYFTTPPPDQKMPSIVSKLLTLGYESKICTQAFPPGKLFSMPSLPNITTVNAQGDFEIAADRLAFIDGEVDPWRPMTPHSNDAPDREDTILRPFKLIPNAVHHYDEWGWHNLLEEPPEIRKIHAEMISFVTSWLRDWSVEHGLEPEVPI